MTTQNSRELVYYVAMSLDHYIARADGSIDGFATDGRFVMDYLNSLRDYDAALMGRATYEWGYQYGVVPGEPAPVYGHMMQYVFSQSMEPYQHDGLSVVRDDPADFVRELKAQDGGAIYLSGGGKLAGYLLDHGLIDRVIIKLNPVILGDGVPLFGASRCSVGLTLLDTTVYDGGVAFLHYAVS